MLNREVYTNNPQLRDYFLSLPGVVQGQLLASNVFVESLGELMAVAENFKRQLN